ncbi:hypothetical protein CERSUDRAFT_100669 [Gelatoporia subvermispora B]|uniref:Uncharacterized protein n=1 Tax=Ceriporiopsis subvermispora (strain B) TaxID=914234 RepID=M2QYW6_CERS8|nr:hypothetical protein CERSUDRAFT_100669 [Gelatoporia subvermispora B]
MLWSPVPAATTTSRRVAWIETATGCAERRGTARDEAQRASRAQASAACAPSASGSRPARAVSPAPRTRCIRAFLPAFISHATLVATLVAAARSLRASTVALARHTHAAHVIQHKSGQPPDPDAIPRAPYRTFYAEPRAGVAPETRPAAAQGLHGASPASRIPTPLPQTRYIVLGQKPPHAAPAASSPVTHPVSYRSPCPLAPPAILCAHTITGPTLRTYSASRSPAQAACFGDPGIARRGAYPAERERRDRCARKVAMEMHTNPD